MVCDANLKIRNIIARWPGSVHDSTIFNDSPLCAQLERGDFGNMSILGDSGYPCRPYLLIPLLQTRTPAEEAYNRSQIATRNPIERLFGVLKRRFPCLQNGMGFKIDNIPPVVVTCAVIHNIIQDVVICILRKDSKKDNIGQFIKTIFSVLMDYKFIQCEEHKKEILITANT